MQELSVGTPSHLAVRPEQPLVALAEQMALVQALHRSEDFVLVRSVSAAASIVASNAEDFAHAIPSMMSPLHGVLRSHRSGGLSADATIGAVAVAKSPRREPDPRFYCSLRAVKVVRRCAPPPPVTVLARMRRVSISSRRSVVGMGNRRSHAVHS